MKAIFLTIASVFLLTSACFAQNFGLYGSGSYQTLYSNPGWGLGLQFQTERISVGLHLNFDLPATNIIDGTARSNSNTSVTTPIKVETQNRVNTYYFTTNYNFLGTPDDPFMLYAAAGMGITNFNKVNNVVLTSFDSQAYRHNYPLDKKQYKHARNICRFRFGRTIYYYRKLEGICRS